MFCVYAVCMTHLIYEFHLVKGKMMNDVLNKVTDGVKTLSMPGARVCFPACCQQCISVSLLRACTVLDLTCRLSAVCGCSR